MGEEDAVGGELSPLSGLICEIVNSAGQGDFRFARKKAGNSETSGFGNHTYPL